ncbi:MAG: hypothetical protein P8R31_09750 [Mariniblastus sp.]|nr:hypothetical protein [Mariniblastus sp.]
MNPLRQYALMAFLDLVSCGFGAAVLIFLITVVADSASKNNTNSDGILVRCSHAAGQKAEVGIEYQRPGSSDWISRKITDVEFEFSAPSGVSSGSEAFLLIPKPAVGEWRFRPHLVDFVRTPQSNETGPVVVKMHVFGKHAHVVQRRTKPMEMHLPGDVGQLLTVEISDP